MLYAYKYVIANEGVDTAKKYPFFGKVSQRQGEGRTPTY